MTSWALRECQGVTRAARFEAKRRYNSHSVNLIFPALVSIGVAVGHAMIVWSARQEGLDVGRAHRMVFCIVATGFVAGAAAKVLYYPELLAPGVRIPWRPLGIFSRTRSSRPVTGLPRRSASTSRR